MGMVRLRALKPMETTMKKFRFTREVRDLVVTMVVAVAGALAAWALANLRTELAAILAVVVVVALVLAVAAVVLKALQRPSEDSGKNNWIVDRRSNQKKTAKLPKSAPGESLAP
jgi:uncharacterized membrane protein